MIYGVTGHRPPKLGGYNSATIQLLAQLAQEVIQTYADATLWVTGMAQGWDLAIAEACISAGVPFRAALAHPKQDSSWPKDQQERFHNVLGHAAQTVMVCEESSKASYHVRDRWIVDHCDKLVALWDGAKDGGTWATVRSAQKTKPKDIINVWPLWVKMQPPIDQTWAGGFG